MPTRWVVEVAGIDASAVRLEEVHAVAARWLDDENSPHGSQIKDWSVSSPRDAAAGGCAVEVGTLTDQAAERLLRATGSTAQIRFGHQYGALSSEPQLMAESTWEELGRPTNDRAWVLDFVTPTTFRTGNRFAPWPAPAAVLRGLDQHWSHAHPADAPPIGTAQLAGKVWVSDLDGHNEVFRLNRLTVSGFLGRIRYECDDSAPAAHVDRLIRLATYCGVGAYTTRGLGVTRVERTWESRGGPAR